MDDGLRQKTSGRLERQLREIEARQEVADALAEEGGASLGAAKGCFIDDLYAVCSDLQRESGLPMREALRAMLSPRPDIATIAAKEQAALDALRGEGPHGGRSEQVSQPTTPAADYQRRVHVHGCGLDKNHGGKCGPAPMAQDFTPTGPVATKPTHSEMLDAEWNAAVEKAASLAWANDPDSRLPDAILNLKRTP